MYVPLVKLFMVKEKELPYGKKTLVNPKEVAENERFRVSWKPYSTNRIDTTRLKEEQPEVYKKYLKTSQSRRFNVQAA